MKKLSLLIAMVLFAVGGLLAQRTISGTISDNAGEALIGATVLVKGTTVGTVSDIDGNFSLEVPEGTTTIVASYTGYATQELELGASNTMDITLSEGVTLSDVVVTALGIKRDKKSLGYAAQEVGGEEVTKVKDANFINSLSGKVSGLDIKRSSTLGGSSNVIIRGSTSLTNNNQALFVVDGTPISNSIGKSDDQGVGRGGYDYGNAAMDINPEDIESMTVLKGAAASALYGSRAANGVILITTKKGKKGEGLGVTFATGYTVGKVDASTLPVYQKEYGEGYSVMRNWYGNGEALDYFDFGNGDILVTPTYEDASNGQKFDPNLQVADWRSFYGNTKGKTFPFVAGANDGNSFYETAATINNSIQFTGGNDAGSFRLGLTNYNQSGIVPNSEIGKNSISFGGEYNLSDKFTVSTTANVILSKGQGRYGTGYDGRNVNQSLRQWYNVGVDIADQKSYYEQEELNWTWNPKGANDPDIASDPNFFDNYYWTAYQNYETDSRTRTMGNVKLTYKLTDWLNLIGKLSTDRFDEIREERIAIGSKDVSKYSRYNKTFSEDNADLLLSFTKYINDDISFGGLLGFNARRNTLSTIFAETNGGLVVSNVYSLANSLNPIEAPDEELETIGQRGYFGQLNFGYKSFVFLDVTGRNDISSTLPSGNNSYFYPSVSLSWIFSEHIGSSLLDYGKLRLNYAEVGNDARFAKTANTYSLDAPFKGNPVAGIRRTRNNADLLPERTKSFEAGLDLNFWKNRLAFTTSIYKSNTYDQLIPLQTSAVTGSTFQWKNAGNVENKGVEVGLVLNAVNTKDFNWNIGINWSKNINTVVELLEDQDNILIADLQGGVTINATKGEPYGAIKGSNFVYHNGDKIVKSHYYGDGVMYAKSVQPEVIGNVNPDWKAGIINSLSYKSIALSFLIDVQHGGDFFSLDTWYGFGTGIYEFTAGDNKNGKPKRDLPSEGGGIFDDNTVVQTGTDDDGNPISDGTKNDEALFNRDYTSAFGWTAAPNALHVYDASYVKLRELSLSYSLPSSMFSDMPIGGIDVSLVGRNLWIISKNSLYSDPEAGLSAGNVQGYQSGVYPSVKEYGINLKIKF